ncbi:hypothetical protein [Gordonia aquimaris]|uniref:Uncharacterized protein n=1 Tax=Gordonia aquimaris TaxID=2984863 RepID=A0A9X3D5K8_9ACTN|nr:hypothetical protein [Gordonia aquimaris]MCX2965403.1 hypothetical protein [Gordonia aquimaris]
MLTNTIDDTLSGPSRTELVLAVSSGVREIARELAGHLANAVFMSPWLNDQLRLVLLDESGKLLFDSHSLPFTDLVQIDDVLDGNRAFNAWASAPPQISAAMTIVLDTPSQPMSPHAFAHWPTLLWVMSDMEGIEPDAAAAAWHADGAVIDRSGSSNQILGAIDWFISDIVEAGVGSEMRDWDVRQWIAECTRSLRDDAA